MEKLLDKLKLFDLNNNNDCKSVIKILATTFPEAPITTYQLGDELYAISSYNRKDTFTYHASDLLKYIVTELGKRPKPIRSRIPRADADLYQSEPKKFREILQSFVDTHAEEFIPF